MRFFDTRDGVLEYERMAEGYDGRALVDRLRVHVADGIRVLELGMGPGKDLDLLLEFYRAVGSDNSVAFLEHYRARKQDADVLQLDAAVLDTDRSFDAIYSNKVLHHLSRDAFTASLRRQAELLPSGGIALHSLWYGDREEEHAGMRFVYYNENTISASVPATFTIVDQERYTEMEKDDSLVLVIKKV